MIRSLAVAGFTVALAVAIRSRWSQVEQTYDSWAGEWAGEADATDPMPEDEQTNIFEDAIYGVRNMISSNDIQDIIETGPGYLVVRRPGGRVQRLKGSRNWRNNNPGNIEYGNFARSMGAIGTDGRFAVFPTYDMGRKAKEALIFEGGNYRSLTLSAAINRYAPPVENDTGAYQRNVIAAVGTDKTMSTYSEQERTRILNAMERMEGFKPGTVTDVA